MCRKNRNPANQSQETKRQSQPEGTRHDGLDCSGYNGHSQGNPELEITDVKEEERELGEGEMIPENPIPKKKGKITKNDKTVAEDCSTKQRCCCYYYYYYFINNIVIAIIIAIAKLLTLHLSVSLLVYLLFYANMLLIVDLGFVTLCN